MVALVFPGLGNLFGGMGRALSALWPEVLRRQDGENGYLRAQTAPGTFWNDELPPLSRLIDQRAPILGQVAVGTIVSDWLHLFGIAPSAALGYSLGESAALLALRAWTERDEMTRRLVESPLFQTELAGPCDAARRAWGIEPERPVEWRAGIVPVPAASVRAAIDGRSRVYLLIINSPNETVIGGSRTAVERLVGDLGCPFVPLPMVSTVHCPLARQVEPAYRALHLLKTNAPPGVRIYSAAWRRAYEPDRTRAADAIVAQAVGTIDFPALIERAYGDGLRVFIEAGPGGSCSRMIGAILGDRPHLAVPACVAGQPPLASLLDLLGRLIAERVPVNLAPLYGSESHAVGLEFETEAEAESPRSRPLIRVAVGGSPFVVPHPPEPDSVSVAVAMAEQPGTTLATVAPEPEPGPEFESESWNDEGVDVISTLVFDDRLSRQLTAAETARAEAHEAFLRASGNLAETLSNQLAFQMALIEVLMAPGSEDLRVAERDRTRTRVERQRPSVASGSSATVWLDRAGCLEFAVGSIGAVLGPEFAAIDAHPTRVRLPDEPLMLVDRIMEVEGTPRSLARGRVVTEHDVLQGGWYLDSGRIPTCIAVEAGQADLFLSGYLGIDFITRGLAVYRLLDAVVTFHRSLPRAGEVIRYDITIVEFFRQGETHLFRFQFEGTVDGEPLLTMRDGCAGFFSAQELASGKGIVATALKRKARAGVRPDDWNELAPWNGIESYAARQVDALRRGDLIGGFGPAFNGLRLSDPIRLPGGRMTLVDRVVELDPTGGQFGLGLIRAEADIAPDAWFMTCHFVDDQVMPGTLMYECCLHTLRIFLMRLGWVAEARPEVVFEPVPGVASRLKCRGQVTAATRTVTYEVTIKELGYGPEPYALADALMLADGRAIVAIDDMSIRLSGVSRDDLRSLWAAPRETVTRARVYDRASIQAFCSGKPSAGFGAAYRVFDEGRFIARLPKEPFSFLDGSRSTRASRGRWPPAA